MEPNERSKFIEYIDDVIKASSDGALVWKAVNPTTFVWEGPSAKLSLQRVERALPMGAIVIARPTAKPATKTVYLFQAFDESRGSVPFLTIDSTDDLILTTKFATLFDLVKTGLSAKSLDLLRSWLPK